VATYRYKLVLAESSRAATPANGGSVVSSNFHQGPRLEWCRLDKDPSLSANVHFLPLDATLTASSPAPSSPALATASTAASKSKDIAVVSKAERTVVVTGMGGSSTFVFAHASQAEQFRACLALVVATVFGHGASSDAGSHVQSHSSSGAGAEGSKWEKSPIVLDETDL
jgi:hypothetical protein